MNINFLKKNLFLKNVIANYASVFLLGGGVLILYPIYINILGAKQWGVVSACLLIQSFMFFLDSGMSQIMPRDISSTDKKAQIYTGYLSFYFLISGLGSIAIYISANYLSLYWFKVLENAYQLELALKILSVQFFFQFINNANLGLWNGMQEQVIANKRQCAFFIIKHALALSFVSFANNAVAYVLAFSITAFFECAYNYLTIRWNYFKGSAFFDFLGCGKIIKSNWHFSLSVVVGVIASQLDRILISKYVELDVFGYYSLSVQYGLAFLQFQYPIIKSLIPAISRKMNTDHVLIIVRISLVIIAFMSLPILFALVFSRELLMVITHNYQFVLHAEGVFRLILVSVIINYGYGLLYSFMITYGHGKYMLAMNSVAISFMLIYFFVLSDKYNIITGGWMWIVNVSVCFCMSSLLLLRMKIKCG